MHNKSDNLGKLKKLCEELNDRDEQLKVNAKTLWDLLDVITNVSASLENLSSNSRCCGDEIKEFAEKLEKAALFITERGCKKVLNEQC